MRPAISYEPWLLVLAAILCAAGTWTYADRVLILTKGSMRQLTTDHAATFPISILGGWARRSCSCMAVILTARQFPAKSKSVITVANWTSLAPMTHETSSDLPTQFMLRSCLLRRLDFHLPSFKGDFSGYCSF